jgi:ArsR family transcriptional regulator
MSKHIPDDLLDLMAVKFQMLADPTRLAILRALMEGEKSVGQVVTETERGQANISKHLKMLADSGLLRRRKEGLQVFYRLDDPLVARLCDLVCSSLRGELERQISKRREYLRKLPPAR